MPGSVQNAAPSTVLPNSLCRAFAHTREYPVIDNEYRNGESQRPAQAATSRKKWTLMNRLTPVQLAALRDFCDARNGTHEPFYFYDPYETNPKFSYDPAGAAVTGRYIVRFNTDWSQSVTPGRWDVQFASLRTNLSVRETGHALYRTTPTRSGPTGPRTPAR